MKKSIAIFISVLMIMSTLFITTAFAKEEEKFYCPATLEDDFADDRVLVMFNNETSMKLKDYTADDFSDIGAIAVEDLTKDIVEKIREQQSLVSTPDTYDWIDTSDFNQTVCITLSTKSKQNVLDVVHELEKREDILAAEPDYFLHSNTSDGTITTESVATYDTAKNLDNNSNGAIPTGESKIVMFTLVFMAVTAGAGLYIAKYRKCK